MNDISRMSGLLMPAKKMADLLISVYSEAGHDITRYGTREGISSTTLLESIMMLFERTGEKAYLEFAEHIVATIENNPAHRLMGTMLDDGSVVHPGNGKGYQLMANLIGFLRLYQCTEDERYLQTVLKGWEKIQAKTYSGNRWSLDSQDGLQRQPGMFCLYRGVQPGGNQCGGML